MTEFTDRVAAEALSIRPLRAILTVLAVPFYAVGLLVGVAVVAVIWAVGAVRLGVRDVRALGAQKPPPAGPAAAVDALDVEDD